MNKPRSPSAEIRPPRVHEGKQLANRRFYGSEEGPLISLNSQARA